MRSAAKREAMAVHGWDAVELRRDAPLPKGALDGVTHALISIPPDEQGDVVLDTCAALLQSPTLEWIGYLSSTGVYGDHGGAWVDEDAPLNPAGSARGQRRQDAEARWRALPPALPVHVFRLAGLYGPGRNALLSARAGRARRLDKPGLVFSRVHTADVLQVLDASVARPRPGAVYNVADREPAPSHEVTRFACELLGIEPPPLEPYDPARVSPALAGFYADSKRVRAERILSELGVALRYPTYREGLRALLATLA